MAEKYMQGKYVYSDGNVMSDMFPAEALDRIPNFEFWDEDILINTYPRAGTTWLQQIACLIMDDADVKTSKDSSLHDRCPFMERKHQDYCALDELPKMASPRIIKSHLPYSFFKGNFEKAGEIGFKTLVCMRNPKDVLVSFYNFHKMNCNIGWPDMTFDTFFELFKNKQLIFGDVFDHIVSWWEAKDNPNIYFVKYEDMKSDPKEEIIKLASFLGKSLTDAQLATIVQESSFASMQKNLAVNMESNPRFDQTVSKFIRKGEVGDWKNHFTEDQQKVVDDIYQSRLVVHGLTFRDT